MNIAIYHNPSCGTSRNALAMIRAAGIEPEIIEYLKTPPSAAEIRRIVSDTGGTLREVLRQKDTPYHALGLDDPKWTDEDLLEFIAKHPLLLNRPIVISAKGTALCRPSEKVLDLLPEGSVERFVKENGEALRRG
jgi:arsenate reductase (glutaredoxin)